MKVINSEVKDSVFYLTINRPDALNSLNRQLFLELNQTIDQVEANKSIRALVIKGAGRSFVAGADLKELSSFDNNEARSFIETGHKVFRRIEVLDIPTIGLIHGFALGGGFELALCLDIIIAAKNTKLGLPETKLGLIPGLGGTQRLIRKIPIAQAVQLIFTSDMIKAEKAFELGLVTEVTDDLEKSLVTLLDKIKKNGGVSIKHAKRAMIRGMDLSLDESLMVEREEFLECFKHEDSKEGIKAFFEKRKADFKNV